MTHQWIDDPSDVKRAYDLINELDGYHPISLVFFSSLLVITFLI